MHAFLTRQDLPGTVLQLYLEADAQSPALQYRHQQRPMIRRVHTAECTASTLRLTYGILQTSTNISNPSEFRAFSHGFRRSCPFGDRAYRVVDHCIGRFSGIIRLRICAILDKSASIFSPRCPRSRRTRSFVDWASPKTTNLLEQRREGFAMRLWEPRDELRCD
ncbi:hypothetical protein CONLIGDRAFT_225139 [Coniochaeta ligniaria NRRL 30616]|uniref:Uncharacterized protein n=1 Tax=Coniochaeta ligniaria NRRL 30616 TaxID=1408157 RepID=A0A1J7J4A3_9PEZI|nr:hypothetical protein CONLIGDRAFT_225139 [Coniochaeta ligniaria NRRL 30616]